LSIYPENNQFVVASAAPHSLLAHLILAYVPNKTYATGLP
jgi:hypothetical protein